MTSDERHNARYQRRKAQREEKRKDFIKEYNDFSKISSMDSLYDAYKHSMRNVSWKHQIHKFESQFLLEILELQRKLENGEDVRNGFTKFTINERGKLRNIQSVDFRERVVQKSLCDNILNYLFTRPLIYDSGASLEGKGVLFARDRLCYHLEKFYRQNNFNNEGYVLQIDFKNFFASLRHDKILEIARNYITDDKIFNLFSDFINAFDGDVGVGLGSQVSQNSALIYPTKIANTFVSMGIRHIVWYMDDVIVIHKDKKFLEKCLEKIKKDCEELGLTLHPKKTLIKPLKYGVVFLKGQYVLGENGSIKKYPLAKVVRRKMLKLKKMKNLLILGLVSRRDCYNVFVSLKNDLAYYNSNYQRKKLIALYNKLFVYPYLRWD